MVESTAMPATRAASPNLNPLHGSQVLSPRKTRLTQALVGTTFYYRKKRQNRISFNSGHRSPTASSLVPQLTQGDSLHTPHSCCR